MRNGGGIGSPTRSATARRWRGALGATVLAGALVGPWATPSSAVETDMSISTTTIDFGTVAVGVAAPPQSVTLTNTGGDPFGPINIFGGAPPTAEFNASQNCQAVTLPAGGSCTVNYTFTPSAGAPYNDTSSFTISETNSQSDGEDFSVSLTGAGTADTTTTATDATTTTTTTPPTTVAGGEMGGDGNIAGGEPAPVATAPGDTAAPGDTVLPGAEEAAADSDDDGSDSNVLLLGLVVALIAGGAFFLGRSRRPAAQGPDDESTPTA